MNTAGRAKRTIISGLVWITLVLNGPGAPTLVVAQEVDYVAVVETFVDQLEIARRQIDRSVFDLSELSFELTVLEPEELLTWVQETIAFEQYRGLLRGAQGTLLARAGNALDQAVLLAGLMGDAGYDARIVRGQLSANDAAALVLQMAERRPAQPPLNTDEQAALLDLQEAAQSAAAAVEDFGQNAPPAPLDFDELAARASSAAEVVLGRLEALEVGASESAMEWLTEEAQEYFWVEYRAGPASPWQEAHPAFALSQSPSPLEPLEYFAGAVPPQYQHRLRIDITIEQKLGDRLQTHVLLDGWERPVANLNGVPLTFANVPWSFGAWEDLDSPMEHVVQNGVFVPMFMDSVASGLAFDTDGNVVPLAEAGNVAAAFFQTLGDQLEDAGAALSALGGTNDENAEDFLALTAQWIDYTLIAPGGSETTFRRAVLDRIAPAARAAGRVEINADRTEFFPLMGVRSTMVATGGIPQAFSIDRRLEALYQSRGFLELLARQSMEFQPDAPLYAEEGEAADPDALRPLDLFQRSDLVSSSIAYRAVPTLAVIGESFRRANEEVIVEQYVDIVQNAKRIFVAADGDLLTDVEEAVRAGVWDTVVEGTLLGPDTPSPERFNAVDHIQNALRDGHELVVLRPADAASPAVTAYGPEAALAMTRDLAAGYSILVPPPDATDGGRTAWWRVRPGSGETLGIISDGRGGELFGAVLLLTVVVVGLALAVKHQVKRNECEKRIRGAAGERLQRENPNEYEKQVSACSVGFLFWEANSFVHEELKVHEEKCKSNPILPFTGTCTSE